ncbi:MAG: 4-(cytidine 5'-diphospho)-2-C-methyl-D-erythritol kinase [Longimicrobiales bacterium]|nr:4-(cytidine 5'-diphospho)-2-C-methyl-D-erythritol kinase [Longimicrobiales bacterium]
MAAVRLSAPAKVNLFLRVLERRPDGYHELDTLFQAVDLSDELLVIRDGSEVLLSVEGADLGPAEDNLAVRAARAFLERIGSPREGVGIRLHKRVPAGAGLGGGSSDAAAVLRCLNALWGRPLAGLVLAELGAALGSDVPFFLGDATLARGRGRGELLQAQPPLPVRDLVLVLPPVQVATGPAYSALARHRETRPVAADAAAWPRGGFWRWNDVADRAVNDFEAVVPAAHPAVAASLEALRRAGAGPALLSGSGAACFGVFADGARARATAADLASSLGWPALHVRTLAAFPEPEEVTGQAPGVEPLPAHR